MNGIYIESGTLLSRPDCVRWLDRCGAKWASGALFSDGGKTDKYIIFSGSFHNEFSTSNSSSDSYTHIPDPEQFCREVAKRLGIEEPKFDHLPDVGKVIHPHKTYRVLDSLDGIPLDTRIPLSEWIPPMESEVAVISNKRMIGVVKAIKNNCVLLYAQGTRYEEMVSLDGHWMRIL